MSAQVRRESPFRGDLLVCAPHMDDEALGCGMLIALHVTRANVHVVIATDGAGSPELPAGREEAAFALTAVREAESIEALEVLGVPQPNIAFLGLPDGTLHQREAALGELIVRHARSLHVTTVLVPFRYDRHPDHLALNRAVTSARCDGRLAADVVEYFVYTQWRLLGSGDVRDYLAADDTVRLRTDAAAERKREALRRYRSQTTRYFEGQRRPILTGRLLDHTCAEPETFLHHRPERGGRRALARGQYWVPLACRIEPVLKRWKDRLTGACVR